MPGERPWEAALGLIDLGFLVFYGNYLAFLEAPIGPIQKRPAKLTWCARTMRRDRAGRRNSASGASFVSRRDLTCFRLRSAAQPKRAVTASRVINLRITGPSVSMPAIYLRTIGHGEHAP